MLAGFERLENLNLYSAGGDATFSGETTTDMGRKDQPWPAGPREAPGGVTGSGVRRW
jgi:hypothetical protein